MHDNRHSVLFQARSAHLGAPFINFWFFFFRLLVCMVQCGEPCPRIIKNMTVILTGLASEQNSDLYGAMNTGTGWCESILTRNTSRNRQHKLKKWLIRVCFVSFICPFEYFDFSPLHLERPWLQSIYMPFSFCFNNADVSSSSMQLVAAAWRSTSRVHVVFQPISGVKKYAVAAGCLQRNIFAQVGFVCVYIYI